MGNRGKPALAVNWLIWEKEWETRFPLLPCVGSDRFERILRWPTTSIVTGRMTSDCL